MEKLTKDIFGSKSIGADTLTQIEGVAKWTKILSIVSFVNIVLSIISALYMGFAVSKYAGSEDALGSVFSTIITAAISLALNIILFNASKALQSGLQTNNQGDFAVGMQKMAHYFKFIGILFIIVLCLAAIVIIFGVLAGLAGGFK
jgi:amino acid transporter